MNNITKRQSSPSSSSINLYQFLSKYFFLLLGITYLSVVTIAAISWGSFCPVGKETNSYSFQSTSANSLNNTTSEVTNQNNLLVWFYTIILLGCTATPWLLAYIFRHRAFLVTKKPLRLYPSSTQVTQSKPKKSPTPAFPTAKIVGSQQSNVSYRISSFKTPPTMRTSFSTKTKNIRLPFEGIK